MATRRSLKDMDNNEKTYEVIAGTVAAILSSVPLSLTSQEDLLFSVGLGLAIGISSVLILYIILPNIAGGHTQALRWLLLGIPILGIFPIWAVIRLVPNVVLPLTHEDPVETVKLLSIWSTILGGIIGSIYTFAFVFFLYPTIREWRAERKNGETK